MIAFPLQWPEGWPRTPSHVRKPNPFSVSLARARDDLLNELRLLGAADVVISTDIPTRKDGLPYAGRVWRPGDDPGVAVYFNRAKKPQVMARDLYQRPEANIRAIGLVVEAMRSIERHGGSDLLDRAFTGFAALPAPGIDWRFLLGFEPGQRVTAEMIRDRFKLNARQAHPDRGGTNQNMARMIEARDAALKEIGGGK